MNTYLKPFELTLRCLGPVFIGSGEKRTSKEYHVEGDRVYFPDMELLYADIPAHKRKSFEAFVMNTDGAQATAPLKEWVEPNAVKLDPAKHRGYEVKIGSIEPRRASRGRGGRMTRKKLTLNEIHAFIKDPLGRPYVPGSTVKGMLRSIYLQSLVHKRTAQPVRVPGHQTREHRQYGERFERKELRKSGRPNTRPQDAVNDLFQAIRVTDSPALRTSDLLICQKMDMNVHGKPDGLPLFRECLAPGTSISHRVVVDTSPTARGGWREGERFLETLAETAASVNQARYAEYRAMYPGVNAIVGPIVYLGGGAGYRSKTFVTDQDDMAKVLDAQFGKVVKHVDKTRELRVSPLVLKRTKIDNICYEMGQWRAVDQESRMILFSPIGTADPITALGDGPMLHIVRHYRPIVVVLFLSAEIAAFENADRRYSAAITRLAPETDVRIVTYTNPSVHRFDLFVPVFRNHLVELSAEFPDRTILLNTSSGTPAMQAALVAINVFGIPRTTAVQVSTPARALSKPGDRESPDAYDLELMWDANDDNQPGAPNRCFEATSAALGALLERANLKQLIVSYDYSAAVTIAADSRLPDQVSNLIRGAMHRSRLEHLVAPKFFKDTAFTYDPANKVAEYISALALLAKREQWAEFARSATPAITIVLRAAVAKHLPEDRYLDDMGRVDRRKLEREPEIRCALKHPPKSPNAEWYLYTKDWLALLRQFAPDRVGALEVLGRFESRVRNTAAHEIVSISEDRITKDGGLLPEQLLKILARETGADLTLYDRLNDEIIRQIDMAPLG